jgi:Tfp pilus assembly protein FimT
MKRLCGFSIIELLIIISMVTALIIVAAPSFYGLFKRQFLVYHTNQFIQHIRSIQSNAFIENTHYKIGLNANEKRYSIWKHNTVEWVLDESHAFDEQIEIQYDAILSDSTQILYNNHGNAYICTGNRPPIECQTTPLTTPAKVTLKTEKRDIILEFMPINGYVSSNVGVK